jgi:hypothetical protein
LGVIAYFTVGTYLLQVHFLRERILYEEMYLFIVQFMSPSLNKIFQMQQNNVKTIFRSNIMTCELLIPQ